MLKSILDTIAKPFVWLGGVFARLGAILRVVLGIVLAVLLVLYGIFFWNTQVWNDFDPDYAEAYATATSTAGDVPEPSGGIVSDDADKNATAADKTPDKTCRRSMIVRAAADLTDFNVNQNGWISSMLLYKMGLFGIPWQSTPFFDNKAAFQQGAHQAVGRTAVELVDTLGRVRGTSEPDKDLQKARSDLQYNEFYWYWSFSPFGPKTPSPAVYRSAIKSFNKYNERLQSCDALFDARADNLLEFLDRIARDIGGTSATLRERSENYNSGWFDTRADDRFWFAYGQLYAYYGILTAARADFEDVIRERRLEAIWDELESQLRASLNISPFIISNGAEAGWIMPSHLATLGFYILRVRSNLVEIRTILDR
ncbi:hypothetical protein AUC68_05880 [Methyloceanibacter methanicus]|uniref:DUF2333 domain-containing protein n=1 Tax=Methyloceanibacter methanicus TaxID=1774968 RepID=A0A1E3W131_9HYPH|nr:DUF2333 family protein [Methyloceanibacter methanicus]ODR99490.1 hypothetical protein AUC68_05880 [Methyloceanibacter methanicus]